MRWLVTGGCGFIGRNLIASLLARPGDDRHEIAVLDNLSASTLDELAAVDGLREVRVVSRLESMWSGETDVVTVAVGDIMDAEAMARAVKGADVIVHLAANTGVAPSVENPRADCNANVIGTLNALEAARAAGVKRFVFASSGAPAGICEPPITETIAPRPVSPYGASKLAGEAYCSAYSQSFGVQAVALRFSNVYGPYSGRKGSVVASFLRRALAGEAVTVYGDGSQTRDFIFVEDLVRAVRLAATTDGVGGEIFQVATGRETSVNELLDCLRPLVREAGLPEITVANEPIRVGDVPRNFASPEKARRMLGWEALTELDDGLRQTVAWFRTEWAGGNS